MKAYRIRNKDGEYACDNSWQWSKEGKLWLTNRRVRGYLALFGTIPDDWTVEEYEIIKTNEFGAKEFMEKK